MFLLLALAVASMAARPAPQNSPLTLTVEAGIGGWYRPTQWMPVQVNIDSQNIRLEGFLQVRVQSALSAEYETLYRSPLNIANDGARRIFLYVSLEEFTREITVELVDGAGRVRARQTEPVQSLRYEDTLYAVVTDSVNGPLDVSRPSVGRGQSYQVTWRLSDLPPSAEALRPLDILVFSDVETSSLSPDQSAALRQWVTGGGHLIVTGGGNWQRTTLGLLDLLPTEPSRTITGKSASLLGAFLARPDDSLESEILLSANSPKAGAQILLADEQTPWLVRGTLGAGVVDFAAFDGASEPLRSWADLPFVWHELVMSRGSRPSWSYGVERFGLARDAVGTVAGFDLPSLVQLTLFLLAYILLMGPANYLFLRLVRRRELAWLTIPALIGLFTFFAYFTGFSLRGNTVAVTHIGLVQVWEDSPTARYDGVVGVLAPRRTTYNITAAEGFTLRALPDVQPPNGLSALTIQESGSFSARDVPVDAAIMIPLATSGQLPAPPFEGQATLTLRGQDISARLEGSVSHDLPFTLRATRILLDSEVFLIGDMRPAQAYPFSLTAPLDRHPRHTLGNRVDPSRPVVNVGFFGGTVNDEGLCLIQNGLNVVYEKIMRGQDVSCFGTLTDSKALTLRQRALLTTAFNNEIDANAGRHTAAYLVGWGDRPLHDLTLERQSQSTEASILYIYKIPLTYRFDNPNSANIPPAFFSWSLIERDLPNRLNEINPDMSFQLNANTPNGQGVALRLTPHLPINLTSLERLNLRVYTKSLSADLQVSLWNWQEKAWQVLPNPNNRFEWSLREFAPYLGAGNQVQVLVSAQAGSYESVERLQLSFSGKG
jgi:hypothetical protein